MKAPSLIFGVRLLHLLASLEALGYSRPPLDEVMGILARHGVPASLGELDEGLSEEVPDGEGSVTFGSTPGRLKALRLSVSGPGNATGLAGIRQKWAAADA